MTDRIEPALAQALDRFTVPPLPPGFRDRMVARALATPAALAPVAAPRRSSRAPWRRGRTIVAGVAAFSLMSAAAAATGVFGDAVRSSVRSAPVIRTFIASVAPEHPKPPRIAKASKTAPVAPPPVATEAVAPPAMPPAGTQAKREAIAERIERRIERRAELGLPRRPIRRMAIAQKLRQLPPQQRAAILERVREIRRERRAETGVFPPRAHLLPEDRAAIRQKFREQRQERNALLAKMSSPGSDAAEGNPTTMPNPERLERRRAFRELRQRNRELRRQLRQ